MSNPITLYPDQEVAIVKLRELLATGERRILLQAPTGWGKGTLATFMINGAASRGLRTLFLVNRRILVRDLSKRLDKLGLDHGVIMSGHPRQKPWLPVHIASVDTLRNRKLPPADLIFADEAHFSITDSWLGILAQYPDAAVIGMTATPVRLDGKGLGHVFNQIVCGPQKRELIRLGRLVKPRVFAPTNPDLRGVDINNSKQLSMAMNKPKIVGDAIEHWERLANKRPTIVFCVDKTHAEKTAEAFRAKGHPFATILDSTPDDERDRLFAALAAGEVHLVSVGVISYGFDCPNVYCVILLRPSDSVALYLQQVGRAERIAASKDHYLVLDHAGNTLRHGLPDEDRTWSLSGQMGPAEEKERTVSVVVCAECWFTYTSTHDECPACGAKRPKEDRSPIVVAGELAEVEREELAKCLRCKWRGKIKSGLDITKVACPSCNFMTVVHAWGHDDKPDKDAQRAEFFELERKRRAADYKPGWSKMQFHARYGYFPPKTWITEFERTESLAGAL